MNKGIFIVSPNELGNNEVGNDIEPFVKKTLTAYETEFWRLFCKKNITLKK